MVASASPAASLGLREKRYVILTMMLALSVTAFNQQMVSVSAPQLIADLGGFSLLSWVFNGYNLASTVIVPIAGKLSDTFGRRVVLLAALATFTAGSLACAAAVSMPMLIAARGVTGLGSGMVLASMLAMLADLFPPAERGKYSAIFVAGSTVAQISGPSVGGLLTDLAGWRFAFLASIPLAVLTFALSVAFLPRGRRTSRPRIDFMGAGLLGLATSALVLGLSWANKEFGWISVETLGLFAATLVFGGLFLWQETRHPEPIIPLFLFRDRTFAAGAVIVTLLSAAQFGVIGYVPTFVQVALAHSATVSGLLATPQALVSLTATFVAGQAISRLAHQRAQVWSFAAVALAAAALLAAQDAGAGVVLVAVLAAAIMAGITGVQTLFSVLIINAAPANSVGAASGVRGYALQVGGVFGIAVLGLILTSTYDSSFASRVSPADYPAVPSHVVAAFDDPTLVLDHRRFEAVKADLAGVDGGGAFLDRATLGQREAVAEGNRMVFVAVTLLVAGAMSVAFLLRETNLRKTFAPAPDEAPAPAGAQPAPAD